MFVVFVRITYIIVYQTQRYIICIFIVQQYIFLGLYYIQLSASFMIPKKNVQGKTTT